METIIVDTREQENKFVIDYFEKNGIPYKREKCDIGDYTLENDKRIVVERKKDILEIASNVCSKDHERFKREMLRAVATNTIIIILIADEKIKNLYDLEKWESPVRKYGVFKGEKFTQVKGKVLAKALRTMEERYPIEVRFAKKKEIGKEIYNILNGGVKLKLLKKIHFDRNEDEIVIDDIILPKKITGTTLSGLCGLNPYKSCGMQALESLKVVEPEPFNEYYAVRGEIAERFARQILDNCDYETQVWDKRTINYDNFPNEKYFGGLIDIMATDKLTGQKYVVEVKGKSLKDYDRIVEKGSPHEELQGLLYAKLSNCDLIMAFIFFSEEAEEMIKQDKKFELNDKGKNRKPLVVVHFVDFKLSEQLEHILVNMEKALSFYEEVQETKKIGIVNFKPKEYQMLWHKYNEIESGLE